MLWLANVVVPLLFLVGCTDSAFEDMLDDPMQLLKAFFVEMVEWETVAHENISLPQEDEKRMRLIPQLRSIQGRYCAPDAKVRGLTCSRPPSFAYMELSQPVFTTKSKVLVEATKQRPGFNIIEKYEFVLVKKDGRWFISKWFYLKYDGKRDSRYL